MKLKYRQTTCRVLLLSIWIVMAYSFYFRNNSTPDVKSEERAIEISKESAEATVKRTSEMKEPIGLLVISRPADGRDDSVESTYKRPDANAQPTAFQSTASTHAKEPAGKDSKNKEVPLSTVPQRTIKFAATKSIVTKQVALTQAPVKKGLDNEPITNEQGTSKSVSKQPVINKPASIETVTNISILIEGGTDKPILVETDTDRPLLLEPSSKIPVSSAQKGTGKPSLTEPARINQSTTAPAVPKPLTSSIDSMDDYNNMGGIVVNRTNRSIPINPHPFQFTLNPTDVCATSSPSGPFLLIYVHTRPESIRQRELIRTTWGNISNYNVTVRRLFVMGMPSSAYIQDALQLESRLYQDILQEDFLDTYHNLTYKAVAALKWVTTFCPNVKLILKTDDDAFVNLPLLLQQLTEDYASGKLRSRGLVCNVWKNSGVARGGKWAVTPQQRKHPTWPNFCQGLAYIMTVDVATAFYNTSFEVPFLWMDDVYITGFLARKLKIVHSQISHLFVNDYWLRKKMASADQWHTAIFSHVKDSELSQWAWSRVLKLMTATSPAVTTTVLPTKQLLVTERTMTKLINTS